MEVRVIIKRLNGKWYVVTGTPEDICDKVAQHYHTDDVQCVFIDGATVWSALGTEHRLTLRELRKFFL